MEPKDTVSEIQGDPWKTYQKVKLSGNDFDEENLKHVNVFYVKINHWGKKISLN